MADLQQPILALIGDILDRSDPDCHSLDTAQIHFERRVSSGGAAERDIALALLWLAGTRMQLHKLRGARHTLSHMRTRFRGRFPDLENIADFLEVRLLLEEQEFRQASGMLDRLQPEGSDPRNRKRLTAYRHYLRGEILTAIGQEAVAQDEYQRALESLKGEAAQRVDLAITAEVYNAEAGTLTRLGDLEAALGAYTRASTVAEHIGFVLALARSYRGRGTIYSHLRDLERAAEAMKEALRIYQEARSPYGILRTCISLGRAHYAAREYGQAMVYFEEARVQCGEGRYPMEEAEVASRIGDILVAEGRYPQAAEFYELDLQIATASGNPLSRAHALKNVGRIQRLLGNFPRSESSLDEARGLFLRLNDAQGLTNTLLQMVLSYVEQGKATQAREALESLKSSAERTGRPLERGLARMLEGMVMRREGRSEEAAELLEHSLRVLSDDPGFYTVLCSLELAQVLEETGDLEASVYYYGQAVQVARDLRLYDMEKRALDLLARVDRAEWARLLHHGTAVGADQLGLTHVFVSALLVELRGVTALLDRDAAEAAAILDGYFDVVTRSVAEYGGVLSKALGSRVLGVFGLGGTCDPVDVLHCSQSMLEWMHRYLSEDVDGSDLGVAVAVATGEALAGMVGPVDRKEHSVVGGPAELAGDLLAATQTGELLLCPATYQAVGGHLSHPLPREVPLSDGTRRVVAYVGASTGAMARRQ